MFEWHDVAQLIEDATFTTSAREALKIERKAWERCDAHRKDLEAEIRGLREGVGGTAAGCNCTLTHSPYCTAAV